MKNSEAIPKGKTLKNGLNYLLVVTSEWVTNYFVAPRHVLT